MRYLKIRKANVEDRELKWFSELPIIDIIRVKGDWVKIELVEAEGDKTHFNSFVKFLDNMEIKIEGYGME